jgi:hypothetical protein
MPMSLPLLAEQFQGALRQGHIAVAVAFATPDVEEHAFGVDVAHLQTQAFTQAEPAGIDGGKADAMIKALHFSEDLANLGSGKDDRQFELGIGADQFKFVRPLALEGFFPEELECADELGGSLAGDFLDRLEMDAVLADRLSLCVGWRGFACMNNFSKRGASNDWQAARPLVNGSRPHAANVLHGRDSQGSLLSMRIPVTPENRGRLRALRAAEQEAWDAAEHARALRDAAF